MSDQLFDFDTDCTQEQFAGPLAIGGGACCLLGTVLVAVFSLGSVPPLYYGIRYNSYRKYADIDNVYTAGRHFIGPWNDFVLFPANVQNIEFSNKIGLPSSGMRYPALHTRTKEGLALNLEVSLQYHLKHQQVGKLYAEFNLQYQDMFISTIRDTLIKVAAEYEAYQLWDQRKEVGDKMQLMVNEVLGRTYAECWGLQLLDIALPKEFDNSIVATQVQSQMITTEQFAQASAQIRAMTAVIESEFDREVKVIKAQGEANFTVITKEAKAKARQFVLDTEAQVLRDIKAQLGLTKDSLVSYQKYSSMKLMSNASLYYGFGKGSQVLLQPPAGMAAAPRRLANSGAAPVANAPQAAGGNEEL